MNKYIQLGKRRRCQTLLSKAGEPERYCGKPAAWHAKAGLQIKEHFLCDDHRAAFVECCAKWCHRDGWHWPEPLADDKGN